MTDPITAVDWLADNLDNVVVLDATYYLPPDPARSRRDFEIARIPGARLFEVDEIADKSSGLPHMLPGEELFAEAMAALGVDGTRPVVVYDRSIDHFSAPRVWYTLRLFGLRDCYVLDGGLNAWISAGHEVDTGECINSAAPRKEWKLDRTRVVSGRELARRVQAGGDTILDARARDRFDGIAPEPRPGLVSGHMPGSTCIPYTSLTAASGRFAGDVRLREIFAAVDGSEPIVICGSGMTACVLTLGLERIGIRSRLYDASWAEWGLGGLGPIITAAPPTAS